MSRVVVPIREPSVLTHWTSRSEAVPGSDQMEDSVALGTRVLSVKMLSCRAGVAPAAVRMALPRTA